MSKYYLNVRNASGVAQDIEGQEFESQHAAHAEAQRGARELIAETLKANKDPSQIWVELRNETGNLISTVGLNQILRPYVAP